MNSGILVKSLLAPASSIIANRFLIMELAKREIMGRYRGASFGLLWSLISPFLMLTVYTFAFENVLKNRWPGREGGTDSFTIILFVGLIIHGFFADCFGRSPTLVTGNANYVKKVVFPLEILPFPVILSSVFHLLMNIGVLLLLLLVMEGGFPLTVILFPLVILPMILVLLGISWMMAALGVFFRDIAQITGVISTALLFTSSAIIPTAAISQKYRFIFEFNPLTVIIDQSRNVMLWGVMPDWGKLGSYMLAGLVVSYLGYAWFYATKKGFADVL